MLGIIMNFKVYAPAAIFIIYLLIPVFRLFKKEEGANIGRKKVTVGRNIELVEGRGSQ